MIALIDGAIRQVKHTGVPDEAGLNSTEVCVLGPRKVQKCVAWIEVESRTPTRHRIVRHPNQFVFRYRILTVLDATPHLDASERPHGVQGEGMTDSSTEEGLSCYLRRGRSEFREPVENCGKNPACPIDQEGNAAVKCFSAPNPDRRMPREGGRRGCRKWLRTFGSPRALNCACFSAAAFALLRALFASVHRPWGRRGRVRRAHPRRPLPRPGG